MLTKQFQLPLVIVRRRQQGVVLLIALIVLVAMTLAGIAMVRSVYTTNLIAANLGFRQAATNSADVGIETAVNWLVSNNTNGTLQADVLTAGYAALQGDPDPATHQTWDNYWSTLVAGNQVKQITDAATGNLITDASGNTIAYAIQRLCKNRGAGSGALCAQAPPTSVIAAGGSKGSGVIALTYNGQVYYRITVRVAGPHNTVSYVQAVVAM